MKNKDKSVIMPKWTKELVAEKMREYVANNEALYSGELKAHDASLYKASRRYYGGLAEAAEELGIPLQYKPKGAQKRWTPERISVELQTFVDKHGEICESKLRKENNALLKTLGRYYGTTQKGVEAHGFTYARKIIHTKWTNERIERELRMWVAEHGDLNYSKIRRDNPSLRSGIQCIFGSIGKAAAALDLPLKVHRSNLLDHRPEQPAWTVEDIKAGLIKLHDKGMVLKQKNVMTKFSKGLVTAAVKIYGSWERTLFMCGLEGANGQNVNRVTVHMLKEQADCWVEEHGEVTFTKLRETDPFLFRRLQKRYKSIEVAAKALNLPYTAKEVQYRKWSAEDILKELQERHRTKQPLTYEAFNKEGLSTFIMACETHFGTLNKAREAAAVPFNSPRQKWTKQRVVEDLKKLHTKGTPLTCEGIKREVGHGLLRAATRHCGSLSNALREAGLQ